MAVIISNNDPIPTNAAPTTPNDTSWMQDLVVDPKPEVVTETTVQNIEAPIQVESKIKTTPILEPKVTIVQPAISTIQEDIVPAAIVVPEIKKDPIITNIYIAADQANNAGNTKTQESLSQATQAATPEIKASNPKAINLDELFGNTKTTETITTEAPKEEKTSFKQAEKKVSEHNVLQKFMFGLAGSLAIIAGWFFIIKTVFPLTFQNNTTSDVVAIEPTTWTTQTESIHAAPPVKTLAEVYTDKLTAYASSGEFYHEFGRATKNRNLIRYGLFIHKKSLDLQDDIQKAIVLSGQIDTVSIEAYLAQFDEYIGILQETVANDPDLQTALTTFTGSAPQTEDNTNPTTQTSETGQNTGEQINTQPTLDQFLNQVTQSQ